MTALLERQNRIIISLLARTAIGADEIENIVRKGKKRANADNFVKAYNALNGVKTATELATIVGVSKQNMSEVLQTWEENGIVYDVGTGKRPVYVGLMKLSVKRARPGARKKGAAKPRKTVPVNAQISGQEPSSAAEEAGETLTQGNAQ
jgi:hypothetical protein